MVGKEPRQAISENMTLTEQQNYPKCVRRLLSHGNKNDSPQPVRDNVHYSRRMSWAKGTSRKQIGYKLTIPSAIDVCHTLLFNVQILQIQTLNQSQLIWAKAVH